MTATRLEAHPRGSGDRPPPLLREIAETAPEHARRTCGYRERDARRTFHRACRPQSADRCSSGRDEVKPSEVKA
jgi:hypothetical protein